MAGIASPSKSCGRSEIAASCISGVLAADGRVVDDWAGGSPAAELLLPAHLADPTTSEVGEGKVVVGWAFCPLNGHLHTTCAASTWGERRRKLMPTDLAGRAEGAQIVMVVDMDRRTLAFGIDGAEPVDTKVRLAAAASAVSSAVHGPLALLPDALWSRLVCRLISASEIVSSRASPPPQLSSSWLQLALGQSFVELRRLPNNTIRIAIWGEIAISGEIAIWGEPSVAQIAGAQIAGAQIAGAQIAQIVGATAASVLQAGARLAARVGATEVSHATLLELHVLARRFGFRLSDEAPTRTVRDGALMTSDDH
ncbi:hypothetical protein Ctob_014478 [Chrysochromulina tobinii]|uniref:Uncharacterized protein n=1 Tax=Chrysochromulina tobinii TaxID=1460289 RepID=A0A0M0LQB5_9EUKA|nr:hypothetical protein Ctob_014478 [Chrysochromulina tobinii]|eukprot:KOO53229.1 hypothetical protein Ctob_014478 [Chrysochromulina sp. CCMP291]